MLLGRGSVANPTSASGCANLGKTLMVSGPQFSLQHLGQYIYIYTTNIVCVHMCVQHLMQYIYCPKCVHMCVYIHIYSLSIYISLPIYEYM